MLKKINDNTFEGVLPPSDCEKNLGVKWLTGTPTGSFYIGDKDSEKQNMKEFIEGKKKCYIDSHSYFKYLNDVKEIIKKFKHMFYGPIDVLNKSLYYFKSLPVDKRYIYISYTYPDRYLKTSKYDENVSEFKYSLAANITKIKFQRKSNDTYVVYVYLVNNWRDLIMGKASKCDVDSIVTIFNDFIKDGLNDGKNIVDLARLFGIKYCSLIKNNHIDINAVLEKSNYNNENILDYVNNGMLLSNDIIWETDSQVENNDFNVYGIHIKLKNTALNSENQHICIGWSFLGDLTEINSLDELKTLYKSKSSTVSNQSISINCSQIWLFKNEVKIGDYVVFFDGDMAHFGKIIGDYEYILDIKDQDLDYVNNRKVEWLKHINYNDLPDEYRKSSKTQRSFFRLDTFKSLFEKILDGKDIVEDNYDVYETNENYVVHYDFNQSPINDGKNLIVYGTPGCGKSYYVEHELLVNYSESNKIRTTFFQDYTNSDFVGQILPHLSKGEDGKDVVTYIFNPGPFTLALEQAIKCPNDRVALVIEELNRGNAASIFGDIFQLLDRKNGVSEYPIKNVNIIDYLNKKFKDIYYFTDIKLPGNLSILATMNTSDQNVFTLDTAFKRRWKFEKILNTFKSDHKFQNMYIPGANITWKQMVEHINDYILKTANGYGNEDKQLGVYFVDETGMRKETFNAVDPQQIKDFAYKVLEYLWDDVAKLQRKIWFDNNIKSLDELVQEYESKGIEVFNNDIFKDLQ